MLIADHVRVRGLARTDPETYSSQALSRPAVQEIVSKWTANLERPFYGITTDGKKREDLFKRVDEGAPVDEMVARANRITALLSPSELHQVSNQIDSENWRKWSNPEFLIYRTGIRLEDLSEDKVQSILSLIRASTSSAGYTRILGAIQTNEFLGRLCNATTIMNRGSYQFTLYGQPSVTDLWGYSLFGHHLSLNVFVRGRQMVITPMFLGAEPNVIDAGPDAGVRILDEAGDLPLKVMQGLPGEMQQKAQIYKNLQEGMPEGRWNPADQVFLDRHVAGAFQDNRVIPYEGILVSEMPSSLQESLREVVSFYIRVLPDGPYAARLQQIDNHWAETYFCWFGGFGDTDAFYYRIQSPVVLIEFDHHSGVFLLNKSPERFHVHTIVRTPNGGDYGRALV
ncbi:hypothetical protein BDV18DRAFT_152034 [Aspergillus unguis]